jgi:hypothetical protein
MFGRFRDDPSLQALASVVGGELDQPSGSGGLGLAGGEVDGGGGMSSSRSQPVLSPKSDNAPSEPSAAFTPVGFILEGEDWEPGEIAFIVKGPIGRGYTIDDLATVCAALSDAAPQARTYTAPREAT